MFLPRVLLNLLSSPWMAFRVIKILGQILVLPLSCFLKDPVPQISSLRASASSSIQWAALLSYRVAVRMADMSQRPAQDLTLDRNSSNSDVPHFTAARSSQSLGMRFI